MLLSLLRRPGQQYARGVQRVFLHFYRMGPILSSIDRDSRAVNGLFRLSFLYFRMAKYRQIAIAGPFHWTRKKLRRRIGTAGFVVCPKPQLR
jgi:hypothetical protein